MNSKIAINRWGVAASLLPLALGAATNAQAQAVPGGTLDPLTIPKYVTPLVIPPVMKSTSVDTATGANLNDDYDIAVRQFQQQILPGGIWNTINGRTDAFPATPIWSYGPAAEDPGAVADLVAPSATSQFNYPAYTVENTANTETTVDWINDLKDPATGNYRPHLLPVDRSLHWANPEQLPCLEEGPTVKTKDCAPTANLLDDPTILQQPYDGPVPIVTHVHGAHVGPESDGYPEAWWLPDAANIDCDGTKTPANESDDYACTGTLVNKYGAPTNTPGVGSFRYMNDQPSTTLWYHDHTLGMTRNNVYAGPAGFWLIREADGGESGLTSGTLPGPAPVAGQQVLDLNVPGNLVRNSIREIPIVIQDRSFNTDGSLFYPANRAFFEGLNVADSTDPQFPGAGELDIPFVGADGSDIAPIWNPEAFFNVMVVNGVSWPELEVAPAIYRFRLLNGSNSRFLNLSLSRLNKQGKPNKEIPFFQIGAEQSLMPQVVEVVTGKATPLTPGVATWDRVSAPFKEQALLMGLAERADVLVDFRGLKNGDIVRMFNTAPDAPFGGFPDIPADPATTGQVMQFRVSSALLGQGPTDPVLADGVTPNPNAATDPWNLVLSLPDADDPANSVNAFPGARDLALIEEESLLVCVTIDPAGNIVHDTTATPDPTAPGTCIDEAGNLAASVPFAPKAAVLGINGSTLTPTVTLWSDPIVTNPLPVNGTAPTETWELWNHTVDGHPIHLHLVKFKVVNRQAFDPLTGALLGAPRPAQATEAGWKDTVIAYPGEVTRVNATFDIDGLYVWHCHIVEHEDNEMMVPFCVGEKNTAPGCSAVP